MRILSLGMPIPDQQVDNYTWASALSFFDYDAIVVDPSVAVSDLVEGVVRDGASHTSYNEEVVQNGPTTAYTIGLGDLLKRRAEETGRLLGKGGLVVCFAYPDVPHPNVSGFTGCHRYYWLPAPAGLDYGASHLKAAAGTEVRATDYSHPFAEVFERFRTGVQYRALFAEGAAGFGEAGKVIARSPGGAAIAMDLAVGGGRIVFLPAMPVRLNTSDRTSMAGSIVSAIRNTLLSAADGSPPVWVSGFELPGLKKAQEHVDQAEIQLEGLETELEEARNEQRGIERYRRILWQEGKYGLDLPVRDALTFLGMTNFSKPDDPPHFMYDGRFLLVEVEGGPEAIGLAPHYRLRQRMEQHIAERNSAPRGLLVLNAFRDMPPASRPQQYQDSLAVAAETMRYCVIEATKLFDVLRAKMAGHDEDVKVFLRALLDTEGVYAGPVPTAEVAHEEPEDEDDPAAAAEELDDD